MFRKLLGREDGRNPVRDSSAATTAHMLNYNTKFELYLREKIVELENTVAGMDARGRQSGRATGKSASVGPKSSDWGTGPAVVPDVVEPAEAGPVKVPDEAEPVEVSDEEAPPPATESVEAPDEGGGGAGTIIQRKEISGPAVNSLVFEPDEGDGAVRTIIQRKEISGPAVNSLVFEPDEGDAAVRTIIQKKEISGPAVNSLAFEPGEGDAVIPQTDTASAETAATGKTGQDGQSPVPPVIADDEDMTWNTLLAGTGPKGAHA
jgi:hypothetical protein